MAWIFSRSSAEVIPNSLASSCTRMLGTCVTIPYGASALSDQQPLESLSQPVRVVFVHVHSQGRGEPALADGRLEALEIGAHVRAATVALARRVHDDVALRRTHDADEPTLVGRGATPDACAYRRLASLHVYRLASFSCSPQKWLPGRALFRQRMPDAVTASQRPSPASA